MQNALNDKNLNQSVNEDRPMRQYEYKTILILKASKFEKESVYQMLDYAYP